MAVHEQMKYLLPSGDEQRYYRLQIDIPEGINHAIDNAADASIQALIKASEQFCSGNQDLRRVCETLLCLSKQSGDA